MKIPFRVSARTARLIGRENIANAEGAIIEIIKNSYDADSTKSIILFDLKYSEIPTSIDKSEFYQLPSNKLLDKAYKKIKEKYVLLPKFINNKFLLTYFIKQNVLYLIDNGEGMDINTIKSSWMTIGTDEKLLNPYSNRGRIKSGEKGIGRFALDRLGAMCELYTQKKLGKEILKWEVVWDKFEKETITLDKIKANLEILNNKSLTEIIEKDLGPELSKITLINEIKHGTVIKITNLRDPWTKKTIKNLYNNLGVLIPPTELGKFKVFLYNKHDINDFGEIVNPLLNDYDYKLTANFDGNDNVKIKITRNEFDIELLKEKRNVFKEKEPMDMSKAPYDFETIKNKNFTQNYELEDLLNKNKENLIKEDFDKIGHLTFTFYFLKNQMRSFDRKIYPYREFDSSKRINWLSKFAGIKIYRDGFRVRPYGETNESAFDWLNLGERVAGSRFGPGQKAGIQWKVSPQQIYGIIKLSRINNISLIDKASREGLQENSVFYAFKDLILSIINVFEKDRHYIMRPMHVVYEKEHNSEVLISRAQATIKKDSEEIKNIILDGDNFEGALTKIIDKFDVYKDTIEAFKSKVDEVEDENRLLRGLASIGITLSTFTHELHHIYNNLLPSTQELEKILNKILLEKDNSVKNNLIDRLNITVKRIFTENERVDHWIKIALKLINKDRRKRKTINLGEYLSEYKKIWGNHLERRFIEFNYDEKFENIEIESFTIDLDSIFNNLLTNSINAFILRKDSSSVRKISINFKIIDKTLNVFYEDSGPGLEKFIKNKNQIFEPLFSTIPNGTGLGLWIVKLIMIDNNGDIIIERERPGLKLNLQFNKFNKI